MRKKLQEHIDKLDEYPSTVKAAIMYAKGDTELVDVVGHIKEIERRYKPEIARAISELPLEPKTVLTGELHTAEIGREAKRSYSTPRLMKLFQKAGFSLLDLVDAGVVTIKWNWTPLKQFTKTRGIKLKIVEKEVPELGKADGEVGEIWGNTYPTWK